MCLYKIRLLKVAKNNIAHNNHIFPGSVPAGPVSRTRDLGAKMKVSNSHNAKGTMTLTVTMPEDRQNWCIMHVKFISVAFRSAALTMNYTKSFPLTLSEPEDIHIAPQ